MATTTALLFCALAGFWTTTGGFKLNLLNNIMWETKVLIRHSREVVSQHIDDEDPDREEELMWCCNIPQDKTMKNESVRENELKEDERIVQECRTEVTSILGDEPAPKNKARIRKEMECFMQCAYQKFKVTDDTGDIDAPGYDLLMMKLELSDQTTLQKIMQFCMDRRKGYKKHENGYACNPAANNFNHCVYDMMNLYCPEEQRPTSVRCEEHREMLRMRYKQ